MQHGHIAQRGNHDELAQQSGWYRDMYRYQQLEAALDDAPEIRERPSMRSLANCGRLKRLLAYGSPWRKPLGLRS